MQNREDKNSFRSFIFLKKNMKMLKMEIKKALSLIDELLNEEYKRRNLIE
jgi:hypothetical protein